MKLGKTSKVLTVVLALCLCAGVALAQAPDWQKDGPRPEGRGRGAGMQGARGGQMGQKPGGPGQAGQRRGRGMGLGMLIAGGNTSVTNADNGVELTVTIRRNVTAMNNHDSGFIIKFITSILDGIDGLVVTICDSRIIVRYQGTRESTIGG